jgi:transcription-repair coupling factor (superfamily II helicase)
VEFRGGRLSITPIELDSRRIAAVRERIPEAIHDWRAKTLSLRVPDEPGARLAAVLELAEALPPPTEPVEAAAVEGGS